MNVEIRTVAEQCLFWEYLIYKLLLAAELSNCFRMEFFHSYSGQTLNLSVNVISFEIVAFWKTAFQWECGKFWHLQYTVEKY